MTKPIEPNMREGFAAIASKQSELELNQNISDVGGPSIEALVAAILDKKHPLSAEDLSIFESLIDDPELDPVQREEFLQTVWNIVVCIIDYQWDNAARTSDPVINPCESETNCTESLPLRGANVVQSKDEELSRKHNEAAQELHKEDGP